MDNGLRRVYMGLAQFKGFYALAQPETWCFARRAGLSSRTSEAIGGDGFGNHPEVRPRGRLLVDLYPLTSLSLYILLYIEK